MRDQDIRRALRSHLEAIHADDPGDARLVEEMTICGGLARIDMVVLNGAINGYEIKSPVDTLERLPNQAEFYSEVCDTVTIVTAERHCDRVMSVIPPWWGIMNVVSSDEALSFEVRQAPNCNPEVSPLAVAQLLWRNEALAVLEERGLARGLRSRPRTALWERLATEVPLSELQRDVRARLKSREAWLVGPWSNEGGGTGSP